MAHVTLGRTNITVNKNGFGALPLQRVNKETAAGLLKKAYQSGITFFDTARFYTDSEEKIGFALSEVRDNIYIATKTAASTPEEFWNDLNTSLKRLKADYIDIYQFHNPSVCPKPGDGSGLYEAMLKAKEKGFIRHIGISNHRMPVAMEAADSGLYETIQFPFSYLATVEEIKLTEHCSNLKIGFIAMKALAGGLITSSTAAYAYLAQFNNVLPIWGIQKEQELDEFISHINNPPRMSEKLSTFIDQERKELGKNFCRGCGYCLPCPAGIDIPMAARMSLMMRRSPASIFLNKKWNEEMKKIDDCIHCNHCISHCPYGLNTPKLLAENWEDYKKYL